MPQLLHGLQQPSAKPAIKKQKTDAESIAFTLKVVRDALFVLMQHNLVTYAEQAPANIYQLNVLAVLWMLRYPRIITFTKLKFGDLVRVLFFSARLL